MKEKYTEQHNPAGAVQVQRVSAKKGAIGALAIGAQSIGALAVGALALGALAVGSIVVGRLAVRCVSLGKARAVSLEIKELSVERLRVGGIEITQGMLLRGSK